MLFASWRYISRSTVVPVVLQFLTLSVLSLVTPDAQSHDSGPFAGTKAAAIAAARARAQTMTQSLLDLAAQYRVAPRADSNVENELHATAASRFEVLASLMEDDPGAVLDAALPAALRASLPSSVAPYLEQEVELEGTLEILHEDRSDGARYLYHLNSAHAKYSLHFDGVAPEQLLTGASIHVKGVQVANMLALGASRTSVQQLAPAPLPNTLGEQRTIVILINFLDNSAQPYTASDAQAAIFGTTSTFFLENSYQQTWLAGDIRGWFTIPLSSTTCDYASIASYAQTAAAASGVDLSSYAHHVYAFPQNACGWWGLSSVGGSPSQSWINGSFELGVLAHELGHGEGLWHSHSLDCGTDAVVGSNCTTNEYGDIMDMMGASHTAQYNAFQKERLGWLNYGLAPAITTVVADGTYTIDPYEPVGSKPKALKILKSTDPNTGLRTWYYVESRQPIGFDTFLSDPAVGMQNVTTGVLIHSGSETSGNSAFLLDMTPATPVYYWAYDPALAGGQTFSDPDTGLTISTAWANSAGAAVIVKFGKSPSADSPTVSLSTNQTVYTRGQTAYITAQVQSGGSPVAKAAVNFTIIKSTGSRLSANATTGSSGTAVYKMRLGKQDPVGTYQAHASVVEAGQSAAAATTFIVQ